MTSQPFPQLGSESQLGDAGILKEALASRDSRQGRRGTQRHEDTSVYTRVVNDATQFGEDLRQTFRSDAPAPIMKRRLTGTQIRQRLAKMKPEKRMALAKLYGRPFIELAAKIEGEKNAS